MIDIITLTGGLPRDAEQRFTAQGQGITSFTLAQSDRRYNENTKQWDTTKALYLDVSIWDESSDRKQNPVMWSALAAALRKGDQVAVTGKLVTKQWQDKQGNNRQNIEMQAQRFYLMPKGESQPMHQSGQWSQQSQPPAQQQPAQGNVWGQPAPAGDQPPF